MLGSKTNPANGAQTLAKVRLKTNISEFKTQISFFQPNLRKGAQLQTSCRPPLMKVKRCAPISGSSNICLKTNREDAKDAKKMYILFFVPFVMFVGKKAESTRPNPAPQTHRFKPKQQTIGAGNQLAGVVV